MEDLVTAVLAAVTARDWAGLRPLLHPYLHWTDRETGRPSGDGPG